MKYYLLALKKYAQFTGRSNRSEYWFYVLFNTIFLIVAMLLDSMLGLTFGAMSYGIFYCLYALATFVPGLSVLVRRLHDVNKSGWFILIALIPIIGWIWILVLLCTKGTEGENKYGPDPNGQITFDFEQQDQTA
jgi:uncharacterized membrane protein YhaH (DUF805 family)